MVDSAEHFGETPGGDLPFEEQFEGDCPSCGATLQFDIILDLFRKKCRSCGKFPILYFWGKKKGPHLTEDVAYMLYEENLLSENDLENALQTKKQTAHVPFVEFLLSIQYVTSGELEELARKVVPEEWIEGIEHPQKLEGEKADEARKEPLSRHELDALFMLIDQVVSGYGYPFTRIRSQKLELILRGLGADLTAGEIRTRIGEMIMNPGNFPEEHTEEALANSFCRQFELHSPDEFDPAEAKKCAEEVDAEDARAGFFVPARKEDDILQLAIPGHLIAFGFGALFDLSTPAEIREALQIPLSFSVLPAKTIHDQIDELYGSAPEVNFADLNELLRHINSDVREELSERMDTESLNTSLDAESGTESTPLPRIRSIFDAGTISGAEPEQATSPVHPDTINTWIYHPDADRVLPDVITRDELDMLSIWVENQYRKPDLDLDLPPEVPEVDEQHCEILYRACKQLQENEEISPDALGITEEVLNLVPRTIAGTYRSVPISGAGDYLWIVMNDPENRQKRKEIALLCGSPVIVLPGTTTGILEVLVRDYGFDTFAGGGETTGYEQPALEETPEEEHARTDSPDPELLRLLPERIAEELRVVPVEEQPDRIIVACETIPDFLETEILQAILQKKVEFRKTEAEQVEDLLSGYESSGPDVQSVPSEKTNGHSQKSNGHDLELETEPLKLDEKEVAQQLIDRIESKKTSGHNVEIVTDQETIKKDKFIYTEEGEIRVRNEPFAVEKWPTALSRLFPAIPIRQSDGDLILISRSLERKWLLEAIPLFSGSNCRIYIVPAPAYETIEEQRKELQDETEEAVEQSTSGALDPQNLSDVHGSFREMAESRELQRLYLLLLFKMLEDNVDLRIRIQNARANIEEIDAEQEAVIMNLEGGFVYGILYGLLRLSGIAYPDLYGENSRSLQLLYGGRERNLQIVKSSTERGEELLLTQSEPSGNE